MCIILVSLLVDVCSLQTFESPVNYYNADVGRCDAAELFNATDTTWTTPEVPTFTVEVTRPTTTTPAGPTRVSTIMALIDGSSSAVVQ